MSSRQEEKARRKAEREEQEAKAASQAANTRRLQIAGGVLLGLAAVAAVVFALASGGDDDGGGGAKPADSAENAVAIPAAKETDLTKAAKAAGCVILNPENEGSTHVTTPVTYENSNPPASGNHNPVAAEAGFYEPGSEPAKENWVHSLEHGRVEIQYKPGTPARAISQLETLGSEDFNGSPGYQIMVFQNNTNMTYAVAAVAWTHVLGCKTMNNGVFDAIRAFRKQWTDKAPELIP